MATVHHQAVSVLRGRAWRVGAHQSLPDYSFREDGGLEGLGVAVLEEAARRRGMRLAWVRVQGDTDDALRAGLVDLWPAVPDSPERRRRYFLSEPWLSDSFVLILRAGRALPDWADPKGLGKLRLGLRGGGVAEALARHQFEGAKTTVYPDHGRELQAVCRGEVDAAFIESRFAPMTLLRRPRGCEEANFHVVAVPGATHGFCLMAQPGAEGAATVLRDAISQMAREGRLSTLIARWSPLAGMDAQAVARLEEAERRGETAFYALLCSLLGGALLTWQFARAQRAKHEARLAQRAAERANRAKSEFLATLSHEIRTPLNGVVGMTQLLMDEEFSVDRRADLARIRASADLLLGILNGVLDISKVEAGELELDRYSFDLHEMLWSTVDAFQRQAELRGLALEYHYAPEAPHHLIGDGMRVRQIVNNLLSNAVKFTHQGRVRLSVEAETAENSWCRVRLRVEDTGIGVAEDKLPLLFEKFTQADISTSRRYGGTGLGLAICRELAHLMNGSITAESKLGEGSTFTVELMLERAAGPYSPQPEPAPAPAAGAAEGARVLLAEDNELNQLLVVRSLEKLGWVVDVAGNGQDALARWLEYRHSVVLMDCHMPVMDGFETTRRIREMETGPQRTRIIALTAQALAEDRDRCTAAGMDVYLTKPFQVAELQKLVWDALSAGASAGA
jgi:signal transduction histidine kinase/ActR/RegA family two-component response regulator